MWLSAQRRLYVQGSPAKVHRRTSSFNAPTNELQKHPLVEGMGLVVVSIKTHKKGLHLMSIGHAAMEANARSIQMRFPNLEVLLEFLLQEHQIVGHQAAQSKGRSVIHCLIQAVQLRQVVLNVRC